MICGNENDTGHTLQENAAYFGKLMRAPVSYIRSDRFLGVLFTVIETDSDMGKLLVALILVLCVVAMATIVSGKFDLKKNFVFYFNFSYNSFFHYHSLIHYVNISLSLL